MRILFVSDTYYPHLNGVYYFVCRIAPLLQRNGHTVAVVAPSETMHFTRKVIDGIKVSWGPIATRSPVSEGPGAYSPPASFPDQGLAGTNLLLMLSISRTTSY